MGQNQVVVQRYPERRHAGDENQDQRYNQRRFYKRAAFALGIQQLLKPASCEGSRRQDPSQCESMIHI
jgi:hypothetical protein